MEVSELYNKIGQRIVQLRDEMNIRQVDLAFKSDMDDGFLRKIEKGRVNPTVKTLSKIAKGLDVEMKDLFDFEEK